MSEQPEQLPNTIDDLIAFIFRQTGSALGHTGPREAAIAKVSALLTRDSLVPTMRGLSEELNSTRAEIQRASETSSRQTAVLINTTKWYTRITAGLLVVSLGALGVSYFHGRAQLEEAKKERSTAEAAAAQARDAQCKTINVGLETVELIRRLLNDPKGVFQIVGTEYSNMLDERERDLKREHTAAQCPSG